PAALAGHRASYQLHLAPQSQTAIEVWVGFEHSAAPRPDRTDFNRAYERSIAAIARRNGESAALETPNPKLAEWIERSAADIQMMVPDTPYGPYPYAGVPWFSTAFGRDGIITAYEMLWLDPGLARGVLAYLAATQATANDRDNDAEPGK